jgi:hypothetical protein
MIAGVRKAFGPEIFADTLLRVQAVPTHKARLRLLAEFVG